MPPVQDFNCAGRVTLDIRRRVIGPDHPRTLLAKYNLATSHLGQGHNLEAEKLLKDAIEMQRRLLMPNHPDAASSSTKHSSSTSGFPAGLLNSHPTTAKAPGWNSEGNGRGATRFQLSQRKPVACLQRQDVFIVPPSTTSRSWSRYSEPLIFMSPE
jgi:hypothetical protein